MFDYNLIPIPMPINDPSDIPATIKFQKEVLKLQEEYKVALMTREHPDKTFPIYELDFNTKVDRIYLHKLSELRFKIEEEYSVFLDSNKRFKSLYNDALFKAIDLEQN